MSTWTAYRVNGFKFHIEAHSVRKRTYDCSVGICDTGEGDIENDYYGVLKDIAQIEYVGNHLNDVCYSVVSGSILC